MFYAHIILAKKGPLARVWLAAHWDKKITKAHVFETNIEKSVEGIMQPKVKLALRTSGHLLLGVVRIYSRKAKYLLADCNEAFIKIKMAFRPGMVDLPEGHREANVNAITLPEVFHDFDTALPELNDIDIEAQFSINQSRADEITMREDYGSLSLSLHDDGFGDIGFEGDTPDLIRGPLDSNISDQLFEDEIIGEVTHVDEPNMMLNQIASSRLDGDGFGDEFAQPELFEDDIFGEPHVEGNAQKLDSLQINTDNVSEEADADNLNNNIPSPLSSFQGSPASINRNDHQDKKILICEDNLELKIETSQLDPSISQNDDEGFALAPIDASAYKGIAKTKRKRKLIVDEIKSISGEEMKAQLANSSDIVTTLDLAPPTKRLTYWKETGGVEKLFALHSRSILARALFFNYHRHLLSHFTPLEDFSCLGPIDLLALDHIHNENDLPSIIYNKRGRKRKIDVTAVHQNSTENGDNTLQSLPQPEIVRGNENSLIAVSKHSLNIISLTQPTGTALIETIRSPAATIPVNDILNIENVPSLNDIPLTPSNIHHDDFNQGDLTPVELHHGQNTPHRTTIEVFPKMPADPILSLLKETDMPSSVDILGATDANRSSELVSDWNDYECPASIRVQNCSEEQMENETNEQFEERVLNKRAAQLFFTIKAHMIKQDCLFLSELTFKNSRKQAAQKFYSLLVLKKIRALSISQLIPYADIVISRGHLFENPKL